MDYVRLRDIPVILTNVTHLEVTDLWIPDMKWFFILAPNIISLEFDRIDMDPESDVNPMAGFPISPPMEQRTLETLDIGSDVHDFATDFFCIIQFPSFDVIGAHGY